ncbi:Exopolyphosphatase [Talaromyces marneffei ATCC 18224]
MPLDINVNLSASNITSPGLLPFSRHARSHFLPTIRNGIVTKSPIYVLGNQSADLDSIISAILYSYFFSRNGENEKRRYVPLVNLPDVPSGPKLRRLRPEFACALELSISSSSSTISMQKKGKDKDGEDGIVKLLREHIITVSNLREGLLSSLDVDPEATGKNKKLELDCVMVDWNNLPHKSPQREEGKGSIEGLSDLVTFTVNGCIDHRPDEGFVPPLGRLPPGNPRVIISGPGSCTSLIVREIRERGLWPSSSAVNEKRPEQQINNEEGADWEVQLAKLALASILIDTTNLTAEGKVTDVDRDAVSFLTERISSSSSSLTSTGDGEWDRTAYFEQIQYAKTHSLDWLTTNEILGRDYKDWTESALSGEKRVIGIASVVRPLNWIIGKARDEDGESANTGNDELKLFLNKLKKFAAERCLDVVSVMTAFNGEAGQFTRELLVWGLKDDHNDTLEKFSEMAKEQLGLQKWNNFPVEGSHEHTGGLCIWQQENVSQSRKQVAPLLREAFTS